MNSWLIWVVWGAVTFVAVLLGFVGRHFSLRTLRYVTAVTAAVLVVLVTRYGLTHPANPALASSDLANSFTQGADELSAAFFHPLLLVLPGSQVPAPGPGRIGWLVIAVLLVVGYRVLEAWATRRQAPLLDNSALGGSQPNDASSKTGDSVIDGQRYDQFVAQLKFQLSAVDVRAPAILPGGTRSNGLASIAEASGVTGGGLAGAIIRFFGMLWPNPRRFQVRVRVESGHGAPQNTESTKVTVSVDEPATGESIATKTIAARNLDEAAALVAGYVGQHILKRDPTTPPWGVGAADGRDLAATLLARQVRVDVKSPEDISRAQGMQIGHLERATGNSQCAGVVRYELAQLYELANEHMAALRLHAVNREQHPRFYRGRYRLSMSLEMIARMIANPAYQLRHTDRDLLDESLTILSRSNVIENVQGREDIVAGKKLPPGLSETLLKAAKEELSVIRRQATLWHVIWGTFRHRDERVIRMPLWGLRKRQSFHDGLCVAELLVAIRLNEASELPRHMKLARRVATDIAGDSVPIEKRLTDPALCDMPEAPDRPPARKRDGTRWLPWQRRTPSWEAAYNTACIYAALDRDHRVVLSLQRAINNRDCEMQRPSDWISHDPDFFCLKAPNEFNDFLDAQERKDYPAANGIDYYVLFRDDETRSWEDAWSYGYVSAGGGSQWSKPLQRLQPGVRVFVHHLHDGYVGIGRVLEGPVPISDFKVINGGETQSLLDIPLRNDNIKRNATDPERAEYLVRVDWEWTVPAGQGVWAKHFFSRRVTVTELRDQVTSRKLCAHAGVPFTEDQPDRGSQPY